MLRNGASVVLNFVVILAGIVAIRLLTSYGGSGVNLNLGWYSCRGGTVVQSVVPGSVNVFFVYVQTYGRDVRK